MSDEKQDDDAVVETVRPPEEKKPDGNGKAHLIDEGCFLCVSLPSKSTIEDVSDAEYHYAFGFAVGVGTVLRGEGPYYCTHHRAIVRKAMLAQGINWGAPERPVDLVVGRG